MVTKTKIRVAPSWAAPAKVGTPDYQETVYSGSVAHRIVLSANEAAVRLGLLMSPIASPYPHYKVPLASGLTYHVVDLATGVDTPWTCPVGYTHTILSYWWAFNQPAEGLQYLDAALLSSLHEMAYDPHYEHDIFEDYNPLDPTGLLPHTMDFTITNNGMANMSGYFMCIGKLKEIGTPPFPDTKEVKCIHCNYTHRVDRKLGKVKCPKCGKETIYMPIIFGREL